MFNKFKFYSISLKSHPNVFICYCLSRAEAQEYIYNFMKVKHYTHFSEWCRYKEIDENSWESFYSYYCTVIPNEEKEDYLIHTIKYRKKELASILRMFAKCIPLNCSFETKAEHKYFQEQEKIREKFGDIITRFKDELQDDSTEDNTDRLVN